MKTDPEEKPRPRLPKLPRRKPRNVPRRMRWPVTHTPPDIDLMKPERLGTGFCSCGQRMVDGAVCMRCLDLDNWFDQ
jgi:hypothetical protein